VLRCVEMDARLRAGTRGVRAYRCGLRFVDLSPTQSDSVNELCWHYAVPLSYDVFNHHPGGLPPLRLPVLLFRGGATEPTWYAVTHELSPTGLTALLDAEVEAGTEVRFRMATPGEEVCGTARIAEVRPLTLAARNYSQCTFTFTQLEDVGRTTLDVLLGRPNARRLRPLLRPHKHPRGVPARHAATSALLMLAFLAPVAFGVYRLVYRDDLFLSRVSEAPVPLSSQDDSRLEAIFRQTISDSYPSNDRLVNLENALLHAGKKSDAVQVTRIFAKRDLNNLSLQLAYAQALDDLGEPGAGLEEYQKLLKRIDKGDFPGQRRTAVLLAAARTAVHANQFGQAIPWYREVLTGAPENEDAVRDELGGVLLNANQPEDAVALLDHVSPEDWDGTLLLTEGDLRAGDYAAAEKNARTLLGRRPDNLDANLLLMDALAREGNVVAAREMASKLMETHPHLPRVRIVTGQSALAVGDYQTALLLFQALLLDGTTLGVDEAVVQRGLIDAASALPKVDQVNSAVTEKLVRDTAKGPLAKDSVYLGRLAWDCERMKKHDLALSVQRRVLDLEPRSEVVRRQYVILLLRADHDDEAQHYLEGLEQTPEVRSLLVDVYLHEKNFEAIERIAREELRINPINSRARLYLVEVALAKNERDRARKLLAEVREVPPESIDLQSRLANLELWADDGAAALVEYRNLLEKNPSRSEWWPGFIDAASTAPQLTAADAKLIRPIAEKSARDGADAVFLSRLAWVLHRLKETALCERVLNRALSLKPAEPAARKELAGVLAAAGRYKEALVLWEGLPLEAEDRPRLASLYEAASDFAGAAAQYRLILEKQPNDRAVMERLGLVLSWKKDFGAAADVYEHLVEADPANRAWLARVAELKLWSGDAAAALAAYSRILDKDLQQPKLWRGFVDAAGQVPRLDAAQAKLARRVGRAVLDQPENETSPMPAASTVGLLGSPLGKGPLLAATPPISERPKKDPLFLSRLAWVLVKAGATADAVAVLDHADALHPTDPAVRKDLAGVFGAVGRYRRAIELFQGLDLTFADRVRLVQFYSANHDFQVAEAECRKLLEARPGDHQVEMMLADVLAWEGKHEEAATLLRKLREATPDSKEIARKLALVNLWGKNYSGAVEQFADLMEGDVNDPKTADDFVAAAAAAPSLDARYRKVLMDLADRTLADPPNDTQFLSRLAQSLRTLKEPSKAADLLEGAVKIDPTSRPLKLQLAQTLYDAGRYDEAKRYFRTLLPADDRSP
jgi:predicted Zn-dependent protease